MFVQWLQRIPVYNAIEIMASKSVGALLVVSEEKLIGIISERDYARKVILRGKASRITEVREIMTAEVVSVTPEDTVQQCMYIMTERRFRHLPVLDKEKIVGVISMGDLVKWVISAQRETIQHIEQYIANGYPR